MAADAPDPAPVPLELVACLRRLVHTFDDPADDADAFLDALREARRVLAVFDARENGGPDGAP
jgi:hypothetical protein